MEEKDTRINKIGEILGELKNENIYYKHYEKLEDNKDDKDYNDLYAMSEVAGLINDNNRDNNRDNKMVELQELDVRDKVLWVVYNDFGIIDPEKQLHKDYRDDFCKKNIGDKKVNPLIKTAFGKNYAEEGYYDYDDSLISSYIFCKTINIPEKGVWHIDYNGGYEYKIRKGEGFYLRGDTMTSWETSLGECLKVIRNTKLPRAKKERIECLCNPDNYQDDNDSTENIYDVIIKFMNVVYTIGNFCPVPMGFNAARSNFGVYDYWDLTLMKIREWYLSIDSKSLYERDKLIGEDLLHNEGNSLTCLRWLEYFGQGQMGWHNFVETLYMQDYVDKDYNVIRFWTDHEWDDKGRVKVKFPTDKNEIEKAFSTMAAMISARTKRIAEALTDTKN